MTVQIWIFQEIFIVIRNIVDTNNFNTIENDLRN